MVTIKRKHLSLCSLLPYYLRLCWSIKPYLLHIHIDKTCLVLCRFRQSHRRHISCTSKGMVISPHEVITLSNVKWFQLIIASREWGPDKPPAVISALLCIRFPFFTPSFLRSYFPPFRSVWISLPSFPLLFIIRLVFLLIRSLSQSALLL